MKIFYALFFAVLLFVLEGCKPSPKPSHPRYEIKKPKVIYTPDKKNLAKMVKQLQGSPYVWAEEGPNKFDCSGFTYYMYGSMGIDIPRVAREQAKVGKKVSPSQLQYGDLIFFATNKRHPRKITHVGMYLGDGWFTHASTVKHEVVYSNLFTSSYYRRHLRICRRYLPEKTVSLAGSEPAWKQQTLPVSPTATLRTAAQEEKKGKAILIQAPMAQIEHTGAERSFYVQVGSFIGRPASALIYKITRQGFHYKIIKFPKEGQTINKLLVGPYRSRQEALRARAKVRASIQKDAFIAEIR